MTTDSVVHGSETGLVNLYPVTEFFTRLFFGDSDGADRRMTENHRRDQLVIEVAIGLVIIKTIRQAPTGGNCDRRQRSPPGNIAECKNMRLIGALIDVGFDVSSGVDFDPGFLQIQGI